MNNEITVRDIRNIPEPSGTYDEFLSNVVNATLKYENIEMIVKETAFNKQREDKLTVESAPAIQLEENESESEELELNNNTSSDEEENRALEPILTAKEKNTVSTLDETEAEKTKEQEELDESVSLFGNIKRNYAQGISPIFNK